MRLILAACCSTALLFGCASTEDDSGGTPVGGTTGPEGPAETPPAAPPATEGGEIVAAPVREVPAPPPGNTANYAGTGPKFECVTSQGAAAGDLPVAVSSAFLTSNPWIKIGIWAAEAPAAGGRLGLKLFAAQADGSWKLLGGGLPITFDGKTKRVLTTIPIAGRPWAAAGGEFEARFTWNDETEPAVVAPFSIAVARRYALVCSIADYLPAGKGGSDLPCLAGAADRMATLLSVGFGFHRDDITVVSDLDVTVARLQKELLALAEKAGPDDVVLFYYTGHGGQVPDLSGDEADGWDEVLVTADARPDLITTQEQLDLYMTDDRLSALLSKFKTKNVTLIFDSCHSGTMTRAGEADGDLWSEDDAPLESFLYRPPVDRALVEMAEDAAKARSGSQTAAASDLDVDEGYVYISAARSWEVAKGAPTWAGGLFTWALRGALINNAHSMSWNELVDAILPAIHQRWAGQSPRVHGAGHRIPFSLVSAGPDTGYTRPSVAITGAGDEKGTMKLVGKMGENAVLAGGQGLYLEQKGVECDVYDGADADLTGTPKGRVSISGDKTNQVTSNATIISGSVAQGDRAVPLQVRVPGATPRVRVGWIGASTPQQKQQHQKAAVAVVNALGRRSDVAVVKGAGVVDYMVLCDPRGSRFQVLVATGSGSLIAKVDGQNIVDRVVGTVLAKHSTFARLSRIANPSAAFRLTLDRFGDGEQATAGEAITVSASVSAPAYLWALAGPEGGTLELIALTRVALKPGERFNVSVQTRDAGGVPWHVKVIASTVAMNVAPVRSAAPNRRGDVLITLLQQAHGGSGEMISTDGWAESGLRIWLRKQ